jgi:RNA polymerase sigma-70 factor (ECF subfamily)
VGADKVARLITAGLATVVDRMSAELVQVNGWPALLLRLDGEIDSVLSVRVVEGLISGVYTVRNPEKLSRILQEASLSR